MLNCVIVKFLERLTKKNGLIQHYTNPVFLIFTVQYFSTNAFTRSSASGREGMSIS